MIRRRIGTIIAGVYLAVAALIAADFLLTPPDGLANIFVAIWTFPVTVVLLFLLHQGLGIAFPFVPDAVFGYYGSHMLYFVPVTLLIALALRRIIGGKAS